MARATDPVEAGIKQWLGIQETALGTPPNSRHESELDRVRDAVD